MTLRRWHYNGLTGFTMLNLTQSFIHRSRRCTSTNQTPHQQSSFEKVDFNKRHINGHHSNSRLQQMPHQHQAFVLIIVRKHAGGFPTRRTSICIIHNRTYRIDYRFSFALVGNPPIYFFCFTSRAFCLAPHFLLRQPSSRTKFMELEQQILASVIEPFSHQWSFCHSAVITIIP